MVYKANRFKWGIWYHSIKDAFPRGWEGWFWWPCCTGDRCEQPSQGGHLPTSSLPGQPLELHCPRGAMNTHHGGSVPVGLALRVWFKPQPPLHGSKEASRARPLSVAAAAGPGQGPAPPEGFVPLGMGVSQALALWRLQLLWLQPQSCQGKGCRRSGVQNHSWARCCCLGGASARASCWAASTLSHTSVGKIPLLVI